ncbi:MAG TPA: ATP-binding protein, partial [Ktedonobacteraceae bacterium]|nr:ATP-binding protein [Ktedonobacteraceae bacterium]
MDGTSKKGREASPSLADEVFAGGGEMGALMRTIDWSATPLGAVEQWPQSLRTAVSICLASDFPMLIWWGPELVKLYNDAYRIILGAKHPRAMGQRGKECWPEIWDIIGPMLEGVLNKCKATWSENQLLLLERNGYAEECYFTFSYSPIRDETGGVGGVFTAVTETTAHVLGERRLRTLREVAASTYDAKTAADACCAAAEVLAKNTADIPFALLYLLENEGKQARLICKSGLQLDEAARPDQVDISSSEDQRQAWPQAQVIRSGQPALVTDIIHRFGPIFVHSPAEAVVHTTLVLPIARPGQAEPYGLLIAGTSPLRALDEEYQGFLTLVAGQVAGAVANTLAYQEARRQAEELAELDRAKTAFFSNVSHEFRTPLTLLLGPIDDALSNSEHPLQEQHRAQLEIVRRNALRLLKLVNTLLDFSRIEAGRALAAYEPVDLAVFTGDLASTFREVIERAGLRFVVDCPPLPEAIFVDRDMWEKIVLNLLSNAFKFTMTGHITITQRLIDDRVELVVQDTGSGIAEEELPHIFERFYRSHNTEARTQEGSGIGLSLVSELARLHGGTVSASSRIGEGTTFTVTIPHGPEHLPIERLRSTRKLFPGATESTAYVEEALRWIPSETSGLAQMAGGVQGDRYLEDPEKVASIKKMPAGRILLADDNADMREYLGRLLRAYWQVETVANGTDALRAALQSAPDLVISDVMMPGLDGFQLLTALRNDPRMRDIPIILLSARAGEEATIEGLEAGADDYLVKPFSARELLARVGAHMELSLMRRAIATQAKQHADENALLYQQAQEAVNLRDELLAAVTHDLKNPLATVMGFTQLLRRTVDRTDWPEKDQVIDGIARIYATATRMNMLIDELLDFAHLQIGNPLNLDEGETDLVRLARQAITAYEQTSRRHQLRLEVSLPELIGWWDSVRIERVLGNLLSNAIKYSPEGGAITVRVTKEESEDETRAILSVADTGIGIPASDLPQIFDRFHRAKNVVKHIKGSGIGLASARHVVEQHGGTISVASQEGVGSTFT